MKAVKIILKNYDKLLLEVKNQVLQTQDSIALIATRKKIEMAWNIGKEIEKHLRENKKSEKSSYGKHLFDQLGSDVGIDQSILYRMRKFYKTYPKLPENNPKLNWNHYQLLSGVKEGEDRKYLEDLVQEKDLSVVELRKTIKKSQSSQPVIARSAKRDAAIQLVPRRGELSCYKLIKPVGADQDYIDCGFRIYRDLPKKLPKSVKIIADAKSLQIYTYRAYLNRIIDGDTVRATLDLGFGILHEEILRLRGINSIEVAEKGGAEATEGLKKILESQDYFIVKTSSTDTYNRYLADIFLKDGTYLNQLLLDKKLATLWV